MKINVPDIARPAQSSPLGATRLSADTGGLQNLSRQTAAAFDALNSSAMQLYDMELQEQANEQYTEAVTQYGIGLADAVDQAAKATPANHRSVFQTAEQKVNANVNKNLTNKVARQSFAKWHAGKYTTAYATQRKLARDRMIQGQVFRSNNAIQSEIANATDINNLLGSANAQELLFGPGTNLFEQGVRKGIYNGAEAATAQQNARMQVATGLATSYIMNTIDPEKAALRLQRREGFEETVEEMAVRQMLSRLSQVDRDKVLDDVVTAAFNHGKNRAESRKRKNAETDDQMNAKYNGAFDDEKPLEEVRKIAQELNTSWNGYTPERRKALENEIRQREDGVTFGEEDSAAAIVELQNKLSQQSLTASDVSKVRSELTQATYEKFRNAIRQQNREGFTDANNLIAREFKYELYKQPDSTDPLALASNAATQNSQAKLLRYMRENPTATPGEIFEQANKFIREERQGFRLIILDARNKFIKSIQSLLGGELDLEGDPVAQIQKRLDDGLITADRQLLNRLQKIRDYQDQLKSE